MLKKIYHKTFRCLDQLIVINNNHNQIIKRKYINIIYSK